MNRSRGLIAFALTLSVPVSVLHAQHEEHAEKSGAHRPAVLGHVSFPNAGNAASQKPFLTGLALLHSFEYDEAADSFRVAEKRDPSFALPYWMEALTHSKIIWGLDDRDSALAVLRRLGPTSEARLAKAKTKNERAFGAAVEAFYANGSQDSRIRAFADSLRAWTRAMPADPEAHVFTALGIIWQASSEEGKAADALNREAVMNAQYVFDRNPLHPGAAHYIIHASDAPAEAARALRAAREYSKIAPDAEHALHMPSHIFLPLGLWTDMVKSNESAWRASRAEIARNHSPTWENDWHSLEWLQYAYLQLGRWRDARALIDTARALTAAARGKVKPADDPDAMFVVPELAFAYGVETGDWTQFPTDTVPVSLTDSVVSRRARYTIFLNVYQRGAVAALHGNSAKAQIAIAQIKPFVPPLADRISAVLLGSSGDRNGMIRTLEAIRPKARPDPYTSMTPSLAMNVDEMLGDALIAAGRPREAIDVFKESLTDRPRKAASMLGLARAQNAAGDRAGAKVTLAQLSKMWSGADAKARARMDFATR